jgi:hypothetical protein
LGVGSKGSFICYIESLKPFFVLSQDISCNLAKQKKSVKHKLQDSDEEHSKESQRKLLLVMKKIQDFRNLGILDSDESRRARRFWIQEFQIEMKSKKNHQEFGNSGFR